MRPQIRVKIAPNRIRRSKFIQIQVAVYKGNIPEIVPELYMRILTNDGLEVWPPQRIANWRMGIVLNIGSAGFPRGEYVVQVSDNTNFSPMGFDKFRITETRHEESQRIGRRIHKDPGRPVYTIFPRVQPTLVIHEASALTYLEEQLQLADDEEGVIETGMLEFHTEDDERVCPICESLDGEIYDLADDDYADIPLHPSCRCWYESVTDGPIPIFNQIFAVL